MIIRRRIPSIVFKFEKGDAVKVGRLPGTITSRVPCEPMPMYYIRVLDREPVLMRQDEIRHFMREAD